MTEVKILVSSLEGGEWRDVAPKSIKVRAFVWPLEIPIFPRKGSDESRLFQVIAQAYGDDELLAETRAIAHFERGKHKRLDRELYFCPGDPGRVCAADNCRGEACTVCAKDGMCGPVDMLEALPDERSKSDAGSGGDDGGDENTEVDANASGSDPDGGLSDAGSTNDNLDGSPSIDAEAGAVVDGSPPDTGTPDAALPPCDPSSLTRCSQGCVELNSNPMNCGRCGRACRSSMCSAGACAATSVLTHTPAPADAGTFIHDAVAIDPPFLYYLDPTFSGVQRITTSNSTPTLVSYPAPDGIFGLLVDSGYLYSASGPGSANGAIHRMSLTQTLFTPIAGTEQSLYLGEMRTNRDQLFVSSCLSICRILAIPKVGGTLTVLAGGMSLNTEFEADDTNVFIRDGAAIFRISATMENSAPALVATFENGEVCRDMWLSGDRLIFATSQRVAIVPKAGGTVTTLASTSGVRLVADAEYAYFIHGLDDDNCSGGTEIYRVPLTGGASVRLVAEPPNCGGPLMQDDAALYWIRGDRLAIRRVEK